MGDMLADLSERASAAQLIDELRALIRRARQRLQGV
ncbi:hypothetical protein FHS02_003410 [Massilia umbonata]|uniref:Uncharacterized protein n=1 Tax=Pseudoduganella umbonata TaxID=864828 RepID=A0A7W5EC52_9BURK|nr:hypothetical protein [Pseudoduganella umbonata]